MKDVGNDHATLEHSVVLDHEAGDGRILDRRHRVGGLNDLRGGHDIRHAPAIRGADIHVFDEAHDELRPGKALCHCRYLAVVHAALHDHVELDRRKARGERGVDSREHLVQRNVHVVHRLESPLVDGIEAHREPAQPGRTEALRLFGKQ